MSAIVTSTAATAEATSANTASAASSGAAVSLLEPMAAVVVVLLMLFLLLRELLQSEWERVRSRNGAPAQGLRELVGRVRAPVWALSLVFMALVVERVLRFV